jgi:Fic-DOC domain mobile mystery protein B
VANPPGVGQTPLDENESQGLLLRIRTQEALNRVEEENILRARIWSSTSRLVRRQLLVDKTLRRIHKEMFGAVWEWAGTYRQSDKNIGSQWHQVPMLVRQLCDNFALRMTLADMDRDRLAVDFHHQLVSIHPFANGNGRHARFCADRLVENLGGNSFRWGRQDLQTTSPTRELYLKALRAADAGDLDPLIGFARSGV